ncbi:hypothetical protein GCM10020370_02900 [Paenibacillus hodogayensis]
MDAPIPPIIITKVQGKTGRLDRAPVAASCERFQYQKRMGGTLLCIHQRNQLRIGRIGESVTGKERLPRSAEGSSLPLSGWPAQA